MGFLVGKAMDLVFDGRAVARPHPFDDAAVHRRAVQAAADDVVRAGVGVRDPARQLAGVHGHVTHVRKHGDGIEIAGLLFQNAVVDRASVDARRGARLQAALRKLQFLQALPQRYRRRIAGAATRIILQAHVDQAIQERAGGQHHRPGTKLQAYLGYRANDAFG
ncbi:hypothetical protein G6F65_021253 [Rhizopus arrhizus]|nr:hypothetical protein G6F65_021253 [Rhizopus arrhizus]